MPWNRDPEMESLTKGLEHSKGFAAQFQFAIYKGCTSTYYLQ